MSTAALEVPARSVPGAARSVMTPFCQRKAWLTPPAVAEVPTTWPELLMAAGAVVVPPSEPRSVIDQPCAQPAALDCAVALTGGCIRKARVWPLRVPVPTIVVPDVATALFSTQPLP